MYVARTLSDILEETVCIPFFLHLSWYTKSRDVSDRNYTRKDEPIDLREL